MYVMALLVVPGLVVAGFMSAGIWASTGTSITAQDAAPAQAGATGAPAQAGATGAPADPADVKGSMTLRQVVDAFPPTTAAQILAAFSAPLDTPTSTQLKDLAEGSNGMDIPGLRTWLQQQSTR